MLLVDWLTQALQGACYLLLGLVVHLHNGWRALSTLCAAVAARLAAAAPQLRPLLAAAFALPPGEHVGSRPRAPAVLGVAVAEELPEAEWPAAAAALATLLAWAHDGGFCQVLLYEAAGALQHPQLMAQLQQQLHRQQLTGAVRLQRGWHGSEAAAALPADGAPAGGGGLTAVLLAGGDGQWPLLAAAAADPPAADASSLRGNEGQLAEAQACSLESARGAAIDEAIRSSGRLRRRLQAAAGPLAGSEPDYVLVTGPALTLAGFPAWAVRSSEIYGVGPLARLDAAVLQDALHRFCTTKQRFGK